MSPLTSGSQLGAGIGIANLPNQQHKLVSKQGAPFTIMVVGESGVGKTTFINTLLTTSVMDKDSSDTVSQRRKKQLDKTVELTVHKADIEEKMFNVRLTVVDTPGFGDYVDNNECWGPVVEFIENQYESYLRQEQQPSRKGIIDMRVHACLYFIRPSGHTLKPIDVRAMKAIGSRVNLIPVIAKADTLLPSALKAFKKRVAEVIAAQGIRVYSPPIESEDESNTARNQEIANAMPFAVIGSDRDIVTPEGKRIKGRQYPWGVVEVENDTHCDFRKLRSLLFRCHMLDLVSTTEEVHYDKYRTLQMQTRKFGEPKPKKLDNKKFREEEEELGRRFKEKVKLEETRFRAWEQKLLAERDRLNKDLEHEHLLVKQIEGELLIRSGGR
ncbi:Septin [Ramicandelaber brevisporus]|nr:Septin [Ramicandelaber brevisporus]